MTRNVLGDTVCDIAIDLNNTEQYVIWGVGGVGETAFKHFVRGSGNDFAIFWYVAASVACVLIECDDYFISYVHTSSFLLFIFAQTLFHYSNN